MLKKGFIFLYLVLLWIGTGVSQPQVQATGGGQKTTYRNLPMDETKQQARAVEIERLLAMPSKARVQYLKDLNPKDRRGLWLQLKKEKAFRQGLTAVRAGQYAPEFQKPYPADLSSRPWLDRAAGTIAYDADFPSVGFGGGALVGNRFNTHTGVPVFANGTVETVQAIVVPGAAGVTPSDAPAIASAARGTTSPAGFVILGPQTSMGGAMGLFSTFVSASGVIDTVSVTGIGANYTGSSFYVLFGDFSSSYIPVLGTGTIMGQGHHGVVGYTGGLGSSNITGTANLGGNLNAFVRAGGNIVPVELMRFEVK